VRDTEGQIIQPLTTEFNRPLKEALDALGVPASISRDGKRLAVLHWDKPVNCHEILETAMKSINAGFVAMFGYHGNVFSYIEVRAKGW